MARPRQPAASRARGPTKPQPAAIDTARYKVEAVSRAMLVLEAFRHGPSKSTAAELAERTSLTLQSVEATLATLERRGLVQCAHDAPDHFRLGLAWLRIADVKRRQLDIRAVALPVMRGIRDAVNETVSLGIRIGTSRVNIEYAESQHEVRRIVQPGFHVALHIGAGGRALMSGLDDAEIEAYLAPVQISQLQKSKLIAGIKAARRDGYAIVEGEVTSDTAAIAAPIRDHVDEVVATVTISMPGERCSPQMRARCIKEAMNGAGEISLALGFDRARRSECRIESSE